MLNIQSYNETYRSEFSVFLNTLFGSSSVQQPTSRYAKYLQFISPWVQQDKLWQMALGISVDKIVLDAETTISRLDARYREVAAQVA
jgi:hypothetical protein